MGCSASKSTTVAEKTDTKAATTTTASGTAAPAAVAVPTGSKTAIVLNFSFTYTEGKKDEFNALLTKVIEYNR